MTLYNRLFLWLLVLFVLLLAGIFYSQLNTTRSFLIEQQSAELDNAIQAIGLPLSHYVKSGDTVAMEAAINAVFDGSYYQQITLDIFDPARQITRQYPATTDRVPAFFERWVDIPTQTRTTTLTSGWLQLGTLSVTTQPAMAYDKLWQSSLTLLSTFVGCLLIGLILLNILLNRLVKRPLAQLERNAQGIANNHFGAPLTPPATRELHAVVTAFNHMAQQLEAHQTQQAQEADVLRKRAYQDPESGLGNRRWLLLQLEAWLEPDTQGGLILLKASAIQHLRQANQYELAAQLTGAFGQALTQAVSPHSTQHATANSVGRLSHYEFLLIITEAEPQALSARARTLVADLTAVQLAHAPDAEGHVTAGVVVKNAQTPAASDSLTVDPLTAGSSTTRISKTNTLPPSSVPQLLAQCDNALALAQQHSDHVAVIGNDVHLEQHQWGKQQWLELCQHAIDDHTMDVHYQTAYTPSGQPLHQELFTRLHRQGKTYHASQFLPALEALGETTFFDCYVITLAGRALSNLSSFVAVNIANHTLQAGGFLQWLDIYLSQHPTLSQQLIFELPESAFIHAPKAVQALCHLIDKHQFTYGIDHYGAHFNSVSYLRHYHPRYVKLDFAYTRRLDDDAQKDALLALIRNAKHLGIMTIATRVETHVQRQTLTALGVEGMQGFAMETAHD